MNQSQHSGTAELILAAQRGDERALSQIFARHWEMCVSAAYARVRDIDRAEDAAQEALAVALTRLHELREPHAFPGRVRTIARRASSQRTRDEESLSQEPQAPTVDLAVELSRQQEIAAVRLAIRALTEPLRGVTGLFYLDQLSQSEICAALSLPLTTVKKRLHDARLSLRRSMISRDEAVERIRGVDHPWGVVLRQSVETLGSYRLVHHRFSDAFRNGREDVLNDVLADDYVHHNRYGRHGKAALIRSALIRYENGEGQRVSSIDCVAEGNRVIHWTRNFPGAACLSGRLEGERLLESTELSFSS